MSKILFLSETYSIHDRRFLEKLSQSAHTVWFLPCTLRVPPAALWAFLSDTERMNRAVDLPPVAFLPLPDRSKKGHYRAETKWRRM